MAQRQDLGAPGGLKWARNVDELETHMSKIVPVIEEHGQKNGVIGFDGCCSELMMTEALKRKGITRFKHAEEAMFDAPRHQERGRDRLHAHGL